MVNKKFLSAIIGTALWLVTSAFATIYEYDTLNRLTKVTYDGGFQIVYSYDEVGNRIEQIATIPADIFADGIVNLQDFAEFGSYWMENNCGIPDWCNRADIDQSSSVGFADLGKFAEFWLKQSSYTVTSSVIGGHGSISPTSGSYVYGNAVDLIASPDEGYQVLSWTGTDNDNSRSQANIVTVTDYRNVQVQFNPLYYLTTSVVGGNGSIYPTSGGYEYGAVVPLYSTPDECYFVKSWTGTDNDSSKNTNNTVTMNTNKSVTVEFEYNPFPNGGFEMGNFDYWNVNGEVWIDIFITEGSYAAWLYGGWGWQQASLDRVISLPDSYGYTVSFDYLCYNGGAPAYVLINNQQYLLISDEQVHTFTQSEIGDYGTLQFIVPIGETYLLIDNCMIVRHLW